MINLFKKYTIRVYNQDGSVKDYHTMTYNNALKKRNRLKIEYKNCKIIIYIYPIRLNVNKNDNSL